MPSVDVLIVTWNSAATIARCLDAVQGQALDVSLRIHVWDNASSDGTASIVRRHGSKPRLVVSPANLGFAGANNALALGCRARHLLLLNPDAYLSEQTTAALLSAAGGSDYAIVGGALYDGADQPAATSARPFPRARDLVGTLLLRLDRATALPRVRTEVDAVSGGLMLITRQLWNTLGGFDTGYLHGGEDLDICLRARRAGAAVIYEPSARALHDGQVSVAQQPAEIEALRWSGHTRFLGKLSGRGAVLAVRAALALQSGVAVLADLSRVRRASEYRQRRSRLLLRWAITGTTAAAPTLPSAAKRA